MRKVAEGRGLSLQEVHKIAKGRIWSGEDALQRGLVDKLGGLQDAVQLAKQEAGLSEVQVNFFDSKFQCLKQPASLLVCPCIIQGRTHEQCIPYRP